MEKVTDDQRIKTKALSYKEYFSERDGRCNKTEQNHNLGELEKKEKLCCE